jgi:protease YdgD
MAIGRLEWVLADGASIPWCTATLVGKDFLLTNAHCLERPIEIDVATGNVTKAEFTNLSTYQNISDRLIFKPNLIDGRSQSLLSPPTQDQVTVDSFEYGTENYREDSINDWALLKISQPLGETYGYLGWRVQDFSNEQVRTAFDSQIVLPGYSGDYPTEGLQESLGEVMNTAAVHVGCSILGLWETGTFAHQCDTTSGASGSPLLAFFDDENYYIIGLHAGSYPLAGQLLLDDGEITSVLNYGVPVSRWAAPAAAMRGEG